jgi:hypothetical protein
MLVEPSADDMIGIPLFPPRNSQVFDLSRGRKSPPTRASRPSDEKLLRSYANDAARLREHAANTTTLRLRARLLEEAANHERLAREVSSGQTGFATQPR